MSEKKLGIKLYKSGPLFSVKVTLVLVAIFLLSHLINNTYSDPDFIRKSLSKDISVFKFHLQYPEQIISYLMIVIAPIVYYGFIRGIYFFEKGIIINRGIPFWNNIIFYHNIDSYRIMKSKYLMSVTMKEGSEFVFTITDADRAVAIMDQNGIQANFTSDSFINEISAHKRLTISVLMLGVLVFLIQHFGFIRYLFR